MTETKFFPQLLQDKSRLQEIYDLRVYAYENSGKAQYVNKNIFKNGWKDDLDDLNETYHWIIEDNNKIIASARLAILGDLKQTGEQYDKFVLPKERPFANWSRLVVHPHYRNSNSNCNCNCMYKLDRVRKYYMIEHPEIAFAVCCATSERHNAIIRLGFYFLGDFESKYWERGESFLHKAYLFQTSSIHE